MSNYQVRRGASAKLGKIEGDLKVGNGAKIEPIQGRTIIVTGEANFDGAAELNSDFECGTLKASHGGVLRIKGNLTVRTKLDVVHSVEAYGAISAEEIDVGGKIRSKSITCKSIRVGGVVSVMESLAAESVDVGGKVLVRGPVKLVDLGVGGLAEVGGGSITGQIRVGGKFESSSALKFGDLQVLGRTNLPGGCIGDKIQSTGKLVVSGDLECKEVDAHGVAEIRGHCKSTKVEVGGKLEIYGSLQVADRVEIYGTTVVHDELTCASLVIGGKFRAKKAIVGGEIDIAGDSETREGLRGNVVYVRGGSTCGGPIVGNRVDIGGSKMIVANWSRKWMGQSAVIHLVGKMTRVEDVYGGTVTLGKSTRCRKVFGDTVEVQNGVVAEEIVYTRELRGDLGRVYFSQPPRKVSDLPRLEI